MKTAKDEPRCAHIDSAGNVVNVSVGKPEDTPFVLNTNKEDVSGLPVSKGWRKGMYNGVDHGFHRINRREVFETNANGDRVLDENGRPKVSHVEEKVQRIKRASNGKPVFPPGNAPDDKGKPPWAETEEVDP